MAANLELSEIFPGTGIMNSAMREHSWAATPLGPAEDWPDALKIPLRMMLLSRFEMWLGWGPDLAFFYNDAYIPTLGSKHPQALGRPMREVWKEVFDAVSDRIASVMHDGIATWDKALLLLLERNGFPEETYHTFSYSPLRGSAGGIDGLMCVVTEETERVISERRLDTLRSLATALLPARTRAAILDGVDSALRTNQRDFPFSVTHLFDEADARPSVSAARRTILDEIAWPFATLLDGVDHIRVPLESLRTPWPKGAWTVEPTEALIIPVTKVGTAKPSGALVLGFNPYRPHDTDIVGFAQLLASQIAGALAVVDAHISEAAEMERLQQLFEQSPSFMAVLRGPEHRFELVNPAYTQLVAHRDLIGKTVRDAVPEVENQGFIELLDRVRATGKPFVGYSAPIMLQPKPGAALEQRFLDFVYQPMRDAEGNVSGIFVEGIDVTPAHEAGIALRKSEAQFRVFAQAVPNHVWAALPNGDLDWFNDQTYSYSGLDHAALVGQNWVGIVHPDDVGRAGEAWTFALNNGETYEVEFRIRRADGAYRWHLVRALPIREPGGAIVRWIGTNTDIDERRRQTAELAQLNATLEQQVVSRTRELMATEEALRQSQKMEAVGQLTGGLAHDFNNLLTGISGSLELLQTRMSQGRLGDADRYINAAQGAARRAAALTHRLLAFSRRQTLDPKPTNVNVLIAGMEDLIRRTVGPSVTIEVVGAGGIWTALVDPNQLENALLNLCINARDAMPDGGRITIETANKWLDERGARDRDLPPGQYLSLCVTDTGAGMPPDVISRAFDPFFTTKPIGQGTGLGLSMVYGFVRQSGGQVRIYSEIGHGTTMCLYLPRHLGESGAADATSDLDSAPRAQQGQTVLVVDDEPTVRMLATDILEELGYIAIEAADGLAALKVIESDVRLDLLITDVGLPGGLNGRQVADAARVSRPSLKVLFITGYAENAVIGNGHLGPGMQVLTKPFVMEALGGRIRDLLAED